MIIDGPCKPLNPGENETVRIVMNVLEAEELRSEIYGVVQPKHRGLKSLQRGLDMVKQNQRDNEVIKGLADMLLSVSIPTELIGSDGRVRFSDEDAKHMAYAILKKVDELRRLP